MISHLSSLFLRCHVSLFSRGVGGTFNVQICLPSPFFPLTKLMQVRVAAKGKIPSELPCLILRSLGEVWVLSYFLITGASAFSGISSHILGDPNKPQQEHATAQQPWLLDLTSVLLVAPLCLLVSPHSFSWAVPYDFCYSSVTVSLRQKFSLILCLTERWIFLSPRCNITKQRACVIH